MTAAVGHRPGKGTHGSSLEGRWGGAGLAKLGIGLEIECQGSPGQRRELGDPKGTTSSVPGHFITNTARYKCYQ